MKRRSCPPLYALSVWDIGLEKTYIHTYIYIYILIILELKRKRKKHYNLLLTRLIVYLFIYYVLELKIYKFLCSFFIDIVASEKWNR